MPTTLRSTCGELLPVLAFLAWALGMLLLIVGTAGTRSVEAPLTLEASRALPGDAATRVQDAGYDDQGFARDGSGWRLRRTPVGEARLRLPPAYRGSRDLYKVNLAILEAALFAPAVPARAVEPLSEDVAGLDLDGDGHVGGVVTLLSGLPGRYAGAAAGIPVRHHLLPAGAEIRLCPPRLWGR